MSVHCDGLIFISYILGHGEFHYWKSVFVDRDEAYLNEDVSCYCKKLGKEYIFI